MHLKKLIILSILVLINCWSVLSQEVEKIVFPPEPNGYISQVEAFLSRTNDKKRKEIIESLNAWITIYQPEENEWIELADVSNLFINRGINPQAQFIDFLNACISFKGNRLDERAFINLLTFIQYRLSSGDENLGFAEKLWEFVKSYNDQGELFTSGAVNWSLNSSAVILETDSSLFISFKEGTLTGMAGKEKSVIECTNGRYYPLANKIFIEQGSSNWESVGFSKDLIFAQMQNFSLDLSKSVYSIDSVQFQDRRYFEYPIVGLYENKIATGLPEERRGYPKFTSYNTVNQIQNIYPDVDYQGGYSLQGQKIVGANIQNKNGYLTLNYRGLPHLKVASKYFVFTDEKATGVNSEISIYLGADSIFHPGLSFRYNNRTREAAMMRDGQGLSNSRFFDNYHELDLDVQMISWVTSDSIMILSGLFGSLESKADFESSDFYSIERFNEIQVADLVNPLIAIKNCSRHFGSRFFTTGDLSAYMDRPYHLVEELLLNLSFLGYVRYDTDEKLIEVTQRCFDFIEKHAKRQDYDMISFRSDQTPPNSNGRLNIITGSLSLDGVKQIDISRERNVTAFPLNSRILVGQNRSISFDGFVQSGLVGFSGTGFKLDYDPFKIKMDSIEYINLKVHIPINGNYENTKVVDISSIIENTSGNLLVDHPDNKSGIQTEEYPDYPMFIADTSAFVYYDQPSIQNGAYRRDTFYFSADNLVIKGHNSVFLKDSLSFNGQLVTAGIFPEINVVLGYQNDQSLGFDTLFTPDQGYPVYNGKGRFYRQINMNSEGLLGKGILEYMGATMESDNFLFLPDEVKSTVTKITIEQDIVDQGSPKASGSEVNISWKPTEDKMVANQEDGLLNLYQGAAFDGDVYIEPDGLKGNGIIRFPGYRIESESFIFFQQSFQANDADFFISSQLQNNTKNGENTESIDFQALNSKAFVDFRDSLAHIESISQNSIATYPELKFQSGFEAIDWNIGSSIVNVVSPELVSLKQEQKNLSFDAQKAIYNKDLYTLNVLDVEQIEVADVIIIPGTKSLTIRPDAFIDSLANSTIIPRDSSLVHRITNATVNLISSNNYKASGSYKYIDRAEREFIIRMDNISVNSNNTTIASGTVDVNRNFFLSPEYGFQGKINLNMKNPRLSFDGHFQLAHDCTAVTRKWIRLNTELDPVNPVLPFDSLSTDINGDKAYAGFFLSNQPVEFYSTFLGPHTRYSDQPALSVNGHVKFDDNTGEYRLASIGKLENPELVEPEIKFDRQNCQVVAEGNIIPGIELGQLKLKSSGRILHNLNTDSINLSTITSIDFFMNDKAMDFMGKELNKYNQAQAVNYSDRQYRRSLQFFIGADRASEILNELSLRGSFKKLPDEFKHSILFSQLDLKWNPERGSFQSVGKIGISNIMDAPVNKLFDGHIEIVHRRGGGTFTMYLETDPGSYFFFYYSRGLLQVLAAPKYEKFNTYVRDTKEAKRKLDSESGSDYQYYLGQYRLVRNFLDEINGR